MKHPAAGGTIAACRDAWERFSADPAICSWEEAHPRLARLVDVLLGATRTRSLLSASQRNQATLWEHIFDSIQALALLDARADKHIVDAGSGNGFPGLPLAVALGGARFSLIERSARKAEFLEYAGAVLSLSNVSVCPVALADFEWDREPVDLVLVRALVPPAEFGALVRNSGVRCRRFIVFTTREAAREWSSCVEQSGYRVVGSHEYALPDRNAQRELLKIASD